MLKKFFSIILFCSSIFAYTISDFSDPISVNFDEISICGQYVVFANKKGVFAIDSKNLVKKICEKNKNNVVPKIFANNSNVFINTCDGNFESYDYKGNLVFSRSLNEVSRSNIVSDKATGNIIFAITNQMLVCYSNSGELLWINKKFLTYNKFLKQKLLLNDRIYFLNNLGLCIVDKYIVDFDYRLINSKFLFLKNSKDLYISDDKIVFISDDINYYIDKKNEQINQYEKDSLFVDGVLIKNISYKNVKFLQDNFRCFGSFAFAFSDNVLAIITKDKIEYREFNFKIKDVFYEDETLVISDGSTLRIAKISFWGFGKFYGLYK